MQERDNLKETVQQLTDEVSDLSAQLAASKKSLTEASEQIEKMQADMEKQAADADAALAAMTAERDAKAQELDEACQARKLAAEEHAARETELKNQLQSITDELEELQSSTKRQAVAWKFQKAHMMSDRDGYKGQVEALRDKARFHLHHKDALLTTCPL